MAKKRNFKLSLCRSRTQNQVPTSSCSQHATKVDLPRPNTNPDIYELFPETSWDNSWIQDYDRICGLENLQGFKLTVSQLRGMVVKKMLYYTRSCQVVTVQVVVSLCLMWIGMILLTDDKAGEEKVNLTSPALEGFTVAYAVDDENSSFSKLADAYKDAVKMSGGTPLKVPYPEMSRLQVSNNLQLTRYVFDGPAILIGALIGAKNKSTSSELVTITAMYNTQAHNSEFISVAIVMKALRHYCNVWKGANISQERTVNLAIHPLPLIGHNAESQHVTHCQRSCIHSSITVTVAMTFLSSMFTFILVKERSTGSKYLQYLSGARSWTFLTSNFMCDMIVYSVECLVIFSSLFFIRDARYMFENNATTLLIVLMYYGVTILPFLYTAQLFVKNPITCVFVLFIIKMTFGVVLLLFATYSKLLFETDLVWSAQTCLQLLVPSYWLSSAFYRMCVDCECSVCCYPIQLECVDSSMLSNCQQHLEENTVGMSVIKCFWWTTIFILLDSRVLQLPRSLRLCVPHKCMKQVNADTVSGISGMENETCKALISLQNLEQHYGNKKIIDNISVSINQGECFGFFGNKKTGKSILIEILTGLITPTGGTILIDSSLGGPGNTEVQAGMSFCKEDFLMDELTGRETLVCYGRLRGVPENILMNLVPSQLNVLRIHAPDTRLAFYRSREKKKISVAVALIGDPKLVILDEPTSGMDCIDVRTVWQLIWRTHKLGCTVIMTTSKMSVLRNGKLSCLASPLELMQKYATGYTVTVKFQTNNKGVEYSQMPFLNIAAENFINLEIFSDYERVRLHLPDEDVNFGKLFALMEDGVRYFHVYDYSVQKTSLKHVLYSFSVCAQEEYIEITHAGPPSFDTWPSKLSHLSQTEISLH